MRVNPEMKIIFNDHQGFYAEIISISFLNYTYTQVQLNGLEIETAPDKSLTISKQEVFT